MTNSPNVQRGCREGEHCKWKYSSSDQRWQFYKASLLMSMCRPVNRPNVIFMMSESPCSPQSRLSAWGILADTKRTWMVFAMSDKHKGKCFTNWPGRASSVSLLSAGVLYCFWSSQKVSPFKEVLAYTSWGIRLVMMGASIPVFIGD